MKCGKCGTEYEGTVCPECGDCPQAESSEAKISENEFSESPKIGKNEFSESPKKSGKPQSAFAKSLKANKKFLIIVAIFLILLIVLCSSLTVVLTDDFRIGRMEKITIGMLKDYVKINLGEPHEIEENETLWKYYSPKYKKFLENAKDDADFSEKKAAFVHHEIRITFSEDKVYAVEMLKDFSENTKDAKKEIKKVQISRNSIRRYTYFEDDFYAAIQYKDGSFKNAPVPLKRQPNTVNLGINRVSWYDEWSRSEISKEITVVPNPDIYLRGRLPGTGVRYLAYEIEGGYALEIFGSGTIATEAAEYPWDEIKNKLLYLKVSEGITKIENNAFNNFTALLSAELPESMTSIGANAFYNCNLKNINFPDSVTSIGSKAFGNCSNLKNINIPDSLTYVGADAFFNTPWYFNQPNGLVYVGNVLYEFKGIMPADTKITLKEGTVSISDRAFYNNYGVAENGLTEIVIPSSVTSIGSYAFGGCSSLASIEIPSGVTYIGSDAFSSCYSLTIYAEASAKPSGWDSEWNSYRPVVWDYKNNNVADDGFIYTVQNGIRYGIKDGVATVVRQPRNNITTTNIPSEIVYKDNAYKVTSIDSEAFYKCRSIESVVIGNGVMSIGDRAFSGCSSLVSIVIPDSVTSIGSFAFYDCSSLVSVEIPSGVTSISDYAFNGCRSIETITVAEGNTKYHSEGNCLIETRTKTLILGCKNSIIPTDGSVTSIGESAFNGCSSLASVVIPSGVTSIGSHAFEGCSSLVSVVIPTSVTRIGSSAFSWCSSLASVEIPSSVTSIGAYAFKGCRSLVSVEIPSSVTSIGTEAFSGTGMWNNTAENSVVYADKWAIGYKGEKGTVTNIVLRADTVGIGSWAFRDCSSLVSVEIPNSVTSIGDDAFYGCDSLTKVEISDIAAWCGIKFENSYANPLYYAKHLYLNGEEVTELVIPEGVTSIGTWAFYNCRSLVSVEIPRSVTSIGDFAFRGCSSLKSIVYGGTKAEWEAIAKGSNWNFNTGNYTVTYTGDVDQNGIAGVEETRS